MNQLLIEDNKFIYCTENEKKELLDCRSYISNKSRIPMHSESGLSIPNLLLALLKLHLQVSQETGEEERTMEYLLLDVILTAELIKTSQPVKAAELGCMNGVLSYHLSSLLGKFHEESTLCCVCDALGNDSGNQWLDRIALVEDAPKLSMLAAEYEETHLAEGHFDFVFINGSVFFEEPYAVIKEAERLVKKGGQIVCYAERQPLLESCFQLIFADREEYVLSPGNKIMAVHDYGLSWNR